MKVKCIIKSYTQERTFTGENGMRTVRDIRLEQVSDNALIEDRFPNEFYAAIFTHVDDDMLNRAVANQTILEFDLTFRVRRSQNGDFWNQRVAIESIATA